MQNFEQQVTLCATACAPLQLVACCSALSQASVGLVDITISPLCAAAVEVYFDGTTDTYVFKGELAADQPFTKQWPTKGGVTGGAGKPLVAKVTAGGPVEITGWYYHNLDDGTNTMEEGPAA